MIEKFSRVTAKLAKVWPASVRERTVTYSNLDLAAVALIALVVSVWAAFAGKSFSVSVLLAAEIMFLAFYFTGSMLASAVSVNAGILFDLPLRLLTGYGLVNTALMVLAWISPFGMTENGLFLFSLSAFAFFSSKERKLANHSASGLWAIGIGMIATSLWCQDSLDPTVEHEGYVVFKPWVDGFYHAVHIRIFGGSSGGSTIEDFRMAGVPARLYHYGMYMLPAFIKAMSGVSSYGLFAGVLAPVGVFFTGLGAYACVGSLFGPWPGVAALVALFLMPDGSQQGMENTFLSYHWLTQISPSATYGLALLAVTWLFVIVGSTRGNRSQLVMGWSFALLLTAYKLHYVIASALLLLLIPALFFKARVRWIKRCAWVALASAFYVLALILGQKVPGVPRIVFDGSSIGETLYLTSTFAVPGRVRDYLAEHMGRDASLLSNLAIGMPYVLVAILGIFLPVLIAVSVLLRKRLSLLMVLFPTIIIGNFVLMFFGLALDFSSSTPEELLHRPLMIVYFFVAAWSGGAVALLFLNGKTVKNYGRSLGVAIVTLLLLVPLKLGPGVQLLWVMKQLSPVRIPKPVIEVADYIREHGEPHDVFQDSQFDRIYAIAALAERRPFVSHTLTKMPFRADMVARRSFAVDQLMTMKLSKLVTATAKAYGLRWFVVPRDGQLRWPSDLVDYPAFQAGTYKVYDLEKP